jgi:hypothetical protein
VVSFGVPSVRALSRHIRQPNRRPSAAKADRFRYVTAGLINRSFVASANSDAAFFPVDEE